MKSFMRIEVYPKDQAGEHLALTTRCQKAYPALKHLVPVRFFKLALNECEQLKSLLNSEEISIFSDPIIESVAFDNHSVALPHGTPNSVIETAPKAGVTDNNANATVEALKLFDINATVSTGNIYYLYGDLDFKETKNLTDTYLANPLINSIEISSFDQFNTKDRFNQIKIPTVGDLHQLGHYQEIPLDQSDEMLMELNLKRCLALTIDEIHFIRSYYQQDKVQQKRAAANLPTWPTDVELEVLAQTWSEHCKHKIFSSRIKFQDKDGTIKEVDGLYRHYIKRATKELEAEGLDWTVSVFSDNAGIVRFDPEIDLSIKVETHNSPSALDPYGGAITGILGVNRDILGCGMGHKPIANSDVFCFASPNKKESNDNQSVPCGLKSPQQILEGVHRGIVDGGNKSGIPTVNGALFFDDSYAGKPLVFCGTVGVSPREINQKPTAEKRVQTGDLIYMVGGAIGADGIHGATMSSLELNEDSPVTAVQIGDPLTQKRVTDFLIDARDCELYSGLTDNGAGGLSSSIGEMALFTGGATIDLAHAPTKYPGLSPYQLVISESQERMSFAVPKEQATEFEQLAKHHGVQASKLGKFDQSGSFNILYRDKLVGELPLDLMHDLLPQMELKASWQPDFKWKTWRPPTPKQSIEQFDLKSALEILPKLLSSDNVASYEPLVRQYDHEVGGATLIKPFAKGTESSPNDSALIWLRPHGGSEHGAVAIGCGLAPRISPLNPYLMAIYAADEAIRNVVASGGDIDHCCLLDNFCWPDPVASSKNPDGEQKLGMLVKTCEGLYDLCKSYRTPLVSGKDSMKNDFRGVMSDGSPVTISVLPTLLVTAMAKADSRYSAQTKAQAAGDLIYRLSPTPATIHRGGLLGSEFDQLFCLDDSGPTALPEVDLAANLQLYRKIYTAHQRALLASCHDISAGGTLCAVTESLFAHQLGAKLNFGNVPKSEIATYLFNEMPGQFIVSISPNNQAEFEQLFIDNYHQLGEVTTDGQLTLVDKQESQSIKIKQLYQMWQRQEVQS
jgi:phosphoribosylformylglycinamidine synthase subunit PurSL